MATLLRSTGDTKDEAQRHNAQYSARPAFAAQSPGERAGELIARMDVAKQHSNKEAFLAAQAELRALVEEM